MKLRIVMAVLICLSMGLSTTGCKKKTAEEKGKEAAEKKIGFVKGVGEGLKEKGQSAGESIGEGLTKSIKGVGQGVDSALARNVRLSQKLQEAGIKVTKAQMFDRQKTDKKNRIKQEKGVSAYIVSEKGFDGRFLLKAMDKKDQEIGRSSSNCVLKSNDAGFVDFIFDDRVELSDATHFTMEEVAKVSAKSVK